MCDYDIDIHVRPPTLLILAARENRVNDIPTVLYTYIHTYIRAHAVVVCVLVYCNTTHTRILLLYIYIRTC